MTKKEKNNMLVTKNVKNPDFNKFVDKKINQVIDIIQRTYLSLDLYKRYDVFSKSSIGQCTDHLQSIYSTSYSLKNKIPIADKDMDSTLSIIQTIFDKLSIVFSSYGTYSINDIYYVVFGTKYNIYNSYDINPGERDQIWGEIGFLPAVSVINLHFTPLDVKMNLRKQQNESRKRN